MKRAIFYLFFSAFLFGCKAWDSAQTNHFQIVSGKYETLGYGGKSAINSIFKIGTVTGTTWIYRSTFDKEKNLIEGWQEISDFRK